MASALETLISRWNSVYLAIDGTQVGERKLLLQELTKLAADQGIDTTSLHQFEMEMSAREMNRLVFEGSIAPRVTDFDDQDPLTKTLAAVRATFDKMRAVAVSPKPGTGNRRTHRQRNRSRSLTERQTEAIHAFGECEGNYSRTAKRLGIGLSATRERVQAAYKKMGAKPPQKVAKSKTKRLPVDRRGNETVTADRRND